VKEFASDPGERRAWVGEEDEWRNVQTVSTG
jgi:hypothetical protein